MNTDQVIIDTDSQWCPYPDEVLMRRRAGPMMSNQSRELAYPTGGNVQLEPQLPIGQRQCAPAPVPWHLARADNPAATQFSPSTARENRFRSEVFGGLEGLGAVNSGNLLLMIFVMFVYVIYVLHSIQRQLARLDTSGTNILT